MSYSILKEKSYQFAVSIFKTARQVEKEKKEFVITKQIIKSATSIGANIEEALGGQSSKDFISKLSIAYKESRETHYWLRILKDTELLELNQVERLISYCDELLKILTTVIKNSKRKL